MEEQSGWMEGKFTAEITGNEKVDNGNKLYFVYSMEGKFTAEITGNEKVENGNKLYFVYSNFGSCIYIL